MKKSSHENTCENEEQGSSSSDRFDEIFPGQLNSDSVREEWERVFAASQDSTGSWNAELTANQVAVWSDSGRDPASPSGGSNDAEMLHTSDLEAEELWHVPSAAALASAKQKVQDMRARCTQPERSTESSRAVVLNEHPEWYSGYGPRFARHILSSLPGTQHYWCKLSSLAPNKPGGYPQVSYGGANKFCTLGELVLWAQGERKPEPPSLPEGFPSRLGDNLARVDVSHLCNNPQCMTIGHIVLESPELNNARKGCVPWSDCSEYCTKCNGSGVILQCTHEPRCLMSHETLSQDEFEHIICKDNSVKNRTNIRRHRGIAVPS